MSTVKQYLDDKKPLDEATVRDNQILFDTIGEEIILEGDVTTVINSIGSNPRMLESVISSEGVNQIRVEVETDMSESEINKQLDQSGLDSRLAMKRGSNAILVFLL